MWSTSCVRNILSWKGAIADWVRSLRRSHLAVVNLRNQMGEIQKSILNELQRIAETYKSDYQIAKQREEGVQKELSQAISVSQVTDQAQIALHELESNSQTYRALYDNFLQRYMELVQQQSFPISEARVISPAIPATAEDQSQNPYRSCHQRTCSDDSGFWNCGAARPIRSRFPHQRANRELTADKLHCARAVIGRRRHKCKVASRRGRLGYRRPKTIAPSLEGVPTATSVPTGPAIGDLKTMTPSLEGVRTATSHRAETSAKTSELAMIPSDLLISKYPAPERAILDRR